MLRHGRVYRVVAIAPGSLSNWNWYSSPSAPAIAMPWSDTIWTIEMPLYRMIDQQAQLLEQKCVSFADGLLYQDLIKKKSK